MSIDQKPVWDHFQTQRPSIFGINSYRLDFVARCARKNAKKGLALEIGLGDGSLLYRLRVRGFAAYGVDYSKSTVQKLRSELRDIPLVNADVGFLSFKSSTFDLVTMTEDFEHLSPTVFDRSLQEIGRILRPTGVLVATVPAEEKLESALCYCPRCHLEFHRWGHQQSFDRAKLAAAFKGRFEKVVIARRFFPNPYLTLVGWCFWGLKALKAPWRPTTDASFVIVAFK